MQSQIKKVNRSESHKSPEVRYVTAPDYINQISNSATIGLLEYEPLIDSQVSITFKRVTSFPSVDSHDQEIVNLAFATVSMSVKNARKLMDSLKSLFANSDTTGME